MSKKWQAPKLTVYGVLKFVGVGVALYMVVYLAQGWWLGQAVSRELQAKRVVVQAERARRDALLEAWKQTQTPASMVSAIREELGWAPRQEGSAILEFADWPAEEGPAEAEASAPASAPPYWLNWLCAFLLP